MNAGLRGHQFVKESAEEILELVALGFDLANAGVESFKSVCEFVLFFTRREPEFHSIDDTLGDQGLPHFVTVLVEVEMLEMSADVSAIHRPLLHFRVERIIRYPRDPCCEVCASAVFAHSSEDQNLDIKETLR